MKQKEFDDYLRDAFEKADLPYNADNWKKLSVSLDEKKERKRRFILWPLASIAASVAMAIGITTWINYDTSTPVQANRTEKLKANAIQEPFNTSEGPAPQQQSTPTVNTPNTPTITRIHKTVNKPVETVRERPIETPIVYNHQATISPKETPEVAQATSREDIIKPALKAKKPVHDIISLNEPVKYYNAEDYTKSNHKPFISMSGGLNYGTLNGGYVMGFAAGKKISEKVYIEGDLAFVGNIGGEKTKYTFVQKDQALAKSTNGYTTTTSSQTIQRFYNLYYAQFTPTVGYHLSKKLTLGVGADMQRLLMNNVLITETDDPKDAMQLPGYDMGLVGKTEYRLSKEIKASVYYRKAMNQTLQSNSKLLNRDYLQVQLKFMILGK